MTTDLKQRITELKRRRNAVILAHNYQPDDVQAFADHTGDSLELARWAAQSDAEVIVLCGVYFMAETAALLCPGKTVLVPDANAGCPMANMITPRELLAFKAEHPNAKVVTYVNSSAAVKALSDICVTSSNAVKIVSQFPASQELLFVPDRNLGDYVAKQLNRPMTLWRGFCPTHERILPQHVLEMRQAHPGALLVVHPECRPDVVALADKAASTTGILKFCHESPRTQFIVGTESGIFYRLRKENPGKEFFPASAVADCPNMKLTSLEKILWCLEDMAPEVRVPAEMAEAARRPIERMMAAS